jgi:hypothetical protein
MTAAPKPRPRNRRTSAATASWVNGRGEADTIAFTVEHWANF